VDSEVASITTEARSSPIHPAWLPFYSTAVIAAVGLLYAASDYNWSLSFVLFGVGILVAGFWVLAFLFAIITGRLHKASLPRWLGIPVIGLLAMALAAADVPLRFRFEVSRPALQTAVDNGSHRSGQVGLFQIDRVYGLDDGVLLVIDSSGFLDQCGLAYAVDGRPDGPELYLQTDLGSGWWFACESF
jgi:hypothetical protein